MKTERAPRAISGLSPGYQSIVGEVSVAVHWDSWLTLRALAAYSSLSKRTLQTLVNASHDPLPSYRIGSKLLVRRSEFDAWMARHRNTKAQARAQLAAADAQALLSARAHNISEKFP